MKTQPFSINRWDNLFKSALFATTYLLDSTIRWSVGSCVKLLETSGYITVLTRLLIIHGVNADSIIINLKSGILANVTLDLMQLTKNNNISSLNIMYSSTLEKSGIKMSPIFIKNYTLGETIEAYWLLADNKDKVTEIFSKGIQAINSSLIKSTIFMGFVEGQIKWRSNCEELVYPPTIASDGTIYVTGVNNSLHSFYFNGDLKCKYKTGGSEASPSIGSDGTVYVPSQNGVLAAIYPNCSLKWTFQTDGTHLRSSPTIDKDGIIYISSFWGCNVYAIYPNGQLKWAFHTSCGVSSSVSIAQDGTIYAGTTWDNGNLYAINPNGSLKWQYHVGDAIYPTPAISTDGTICTGTTMLQTG